MGKRRGLVLLCLIAIIAGTAGAQAYVYEQPVAWDAVAPELATDTIEYEVYAWPMSQGDPTLQTVDALTYLGTTSVPSFDVNTPYRESWAVCVRTKATDQGGTSVFSDFAYSVVEADVAVSTFVIIKVIMNIAAPSGLGVP